VETNGAQNHDRRSETQIESGEAGEIQGARETLAHLAAEILVSPSGPSLLAGRSRNA
jgi:hypothetical protein